MSANWKRLTGGSLLSSRVSALAPSASALAVPAAGASVAGASPLSPVHADNASATASERSRACGFFTVTWVSGPGGHWIGKGCARRRTEPGIRSRYLRVRRPGGVEGHGAGGASLASGAGGGSVFSERLSRLGVVKGVGRGPLPIIIL